VDEHGNPTTDPAQVKALLPFGAHKGYGLSLIDELYAAYIGGSLPTLRNRWSAVNHQQGEKGTCCFFFQCIKPDALDAGDFAQGRTQGKNVKAVLNDILGHGNEGCTLPGQPEAEAAALSAKHAGLLFTQPEIDAFKEIAQEAGFPFNPQTLKTVEI
jgi:LDH2 family malate/lactate/ureidoglycolate dehydrogenase